MAPKPTLLLADDDPRNIFALKAVLQLKGYTILTAQNGKECLDVLAKQPEVDVVLMDMMMPVMDGYEATQALRQQPQFRDLPIIAVTAQAMPGDKERCLAAGATEYIAKPIDTDQLEALIHQHLTK
ncbi:response regulator [Rufibacter immobilis]|uniref:Response regulator n=1 Tax=Rufibacter immobilis TaxID=1348778 RepID=A0A3M9MRW8_9BACT|nr:response regulator [Rufibacter immobilis]RNI28260.1 response regulator [Rufibacter immobilis]